jgi:hypothetical protein
VSGEVQDLSLIFLSLCNRRIGFRVVVASKLRVSENQSSEENYIMRNIIMCTTLVLLKGEVKKNKVPVFLN